MRRESQTPSSHASIPPIAKAIASRVDERRPLVADDVLRLRDDDRPESRSVALEAERLGDGEVGALAPGRPELEAERLARAEHGPRHRRLGQAIETRLLPGEGGGTDVEELVAGRELERLGREVRRRRPLFGRAQRRIAVEARDAPRLAAELLVRPVARVAREELDGDQRRDEAGEHDPEEEHRRQPETQRAGHHREAYAAAGSPEARRGLHRASRRRVRSSARSRPCSRRPRR